jgi:hypothetical protein
MEFLDHNKIPDCDTSLDWISAACRPPHSLNSRWSYHFATNAYHRLCLCLPRVTSSKIRPHDQNRAISAQFLVRPTMNLSLPGSPDLRAVWERIRDACCRSRLPGPVSPQSLGRRACLLELQSRVERDLSRGIQSSHPIVRLCFPQTLS